MPKAWPEPDCEFVLRPHELLECFYHLEVECEQPARCGYAHSLVAHEAACTAKVDLLTLWYGRFKEPPTW